MSNKPIKPWAHEICREAVRCVEICEKDPRYIIDIGLWHAPHRGGCSVCAAGAWMAVILNIPINESIRPGDLEDDAAMIACAMSNLQFGDIKLSLSILGQKGYYRNTIIDDWPHLIYYKHIIIGLGGPRKWKQKVLAIADYLEENFLGEEKEKPQVTQKESVQKVEA